MKHLHLYGSAMLGMVVVTFIMRATIEPIVLSFLLITALWLITEGFSRLAAKKQ